jgi:hypothetical protein
MAMDLCNQVEGHIIKVEFRNTTDSVSKKSSEIQKYFAGVAWYRAEDGKLFISNGEKFISQKLPYESISFEKMNAMDKT